MTGVPDLAPSPLSMGALPSAAVCPDTSCNCVRSPGLVSISLPERGRPFGFLASLLLRFCRPLLVSCATVEALTGNL